MEEQLCFVTNRLSQARLSTSQIICGIQELLIPKLEYGLHYVRLSEKRIKDWNTAIHRCVFGAFDFARPTGFIANSASPVISGISDIASQR